MTPRRRYNDPTDPLNKAMAPPKDETDEERREREAKEQEAWEVSNRIDEDLRTEKLAMKRGKKPVKALVLGQSESGKSTTIKNFQITYANEAWQLERESWRAVIYLNLVRSVNTILDVLAGEMDTSSPRPETPGFPSSSSRDSKLITYTFTAKHRLLCLRMAPLRQIQKDLEALIGSGSVEFDSHMSPSPTSSKSLETPSSPLSNEFYVVSSSGWRGVIGKIRSQFQEQDKHRRPASSAGSKKGNGRAQDLADIVSTCASDIKSLWEDETVQEVLKAHQIRLEEAPGFFLNDVDRIAGRNYEPSDSDVVRARLRTVGVQEYRFHLEQEREVGVDWIIYDVAGIRTQRAAWSPYFDDVDAILFLAPISCFNEWLAEDSSINRLQDSLLLWQSVCSNRILAHVQLVLLLNKCDLLAKKLKHLKVRDYIPDFGSRNNDFKTVASYFRQAFKQILQEHNPRRGLHAHFTSVVDTKATAFTIDLVRDAIYRTNFATAGLI